jgi:protoheme IX farnesyltransferase
MKGQRVRSVVVNKVSKFEDIQQLVKSRLTTLVVFSSVMSYFIAAGGDVKFLNMLLLAIGGYLVAGSANALNEILERDYDKLMERTANRPVAANRMNISEALVIAGIMCLFGVIILAFFNLLTAVLGILSLVIYAFIYTPLKRYSTMAVAVGAIPGALPAMIGCVAFDGHLTMLAFVLFGIQFLWQFPHFWAIGFLSYDQYQNAGFKLLPTTNGKIDRNLGLHSVVYGGLLIPLCLLSFSQGITGILLTGMIACISLVYMFFSYRFYRNFDKKAARQLMFASFFYLPLVLTIFALGIF